MPDHDVLLAVSEAQGQEARDQQRHGAQIAYRIRAELVCCRVYGALNDNGRVPLGEEVREVEATGHGLCYWSEAAARIAESPERWQGDPDECEQGCPEQCRHKRGSCAGDSEVTVPNTFAARPAVGTVLTSADPEPEMGTLVTDDCGGTWVNSGEYLHWVRIDRDDDPESWQKIAGNYGPVTVKDWGDDD